MSGVRVKCEFHQNAQSVYERSDREIPQSIKWVYVVPNTYKVLYHAPKDEITYYDLGGVRTRVCKVPDT